MGEELSSLGAASAEQGDVNVHGVQELQGFLPVLMQGNEPGGLAVRAQGGGGWKNLGQSGNKVRFAFLKEALASPPPLPTCATPGALSPCFLRYWAQWWQRHFYHPGKG